MQSINSLYRKDYHEDLPKCIRDSFSLLTNQAMKSIVNLTNLSTSFDELQNYQNCLLALFQNEYYTSIHSDLKRFKKLLATNEQLLLPMYYKLQLVDQNEDDEIRHFVKMKAEMRFSSPLEYFEENTHLQQWICKHYSEYLQFLESTCTIVQVYFDTEYDGYVGISGFMVSEKTDEILQHKVQYIYFPSSNILKHCLSTRNVKPREENLKNYREQLLNNKFYKDDYWTQNIYVHLLPNPLLVTYKYELNAIVQLEKLDIAEHFIDPSELTNIQEITAFGRYAKEFGISQCGRLEFAHHFNEYQLEAIRQSMDYSKMYTLINGPPGTGKTRTSIGIISLISQLITDQGKGVILALGHSNTVVNDLVRKIAESINQPNSIMNYQSQHSPKVKVIRVGRPEKCEKEVYNYSLEIVSQNEFFNQYMDEELKLDLRRHLPDGQLNRFVLLDLIETKNRRDNNFRIVVKLGQYYCKMGNLLMDKTTQFQKILMKHLENANIIVSTLHSSANQTLKKYLQNQEIRICIIDEAPTASIPAILVPLTNYNIAKFVLLGDEKQLGTVSHATESKDYSYDISLYSRLIKYGIRLNSLPIQYRQVDKLAQLTNTMFYNGQLQNAVQGQQVRMPNRYRNLIGYDKELLFFDIKSGKQELQETSLKNDIEAQAIIKLVQYLTSQLEQTDKKVISIICAYRAQYRYLKQQLKQNNLFNFVEIDTIDSFQGKENHIVIISLVRSEGTGFLKNKKRINVALSRAQYGQYIFGHFQSLRSSGLSIWSKITSRLRRQDLIRIYDIHGEQNDQYFQEILS